MLTKTEKDDLGQLKRRSQIQIDVLTDMGARLGRQGLMNDDKWLRKIRITRVFRGGSSGRRNEEEKKTRGDTRGIFNERNMGKAKVDIEDEEEHGEKEGGRGE